jgi:hypothetical protein
MKEEKQIGNAFLKHKPKLPTNSKIVTDGTVMELSGQTVFQKTSYCENISCKQKGIRGKYFFF